jgi:DNA-binding CsgD family transcriptional regulator
VPHLVLALHALALLAGAAAIGQAAMIWHRHRKAVVRHYVLFLASTGTILLSLAVDRYARLAGLEGEPAAAAVAWILQAAGGLLYIGAAPFFYHALVGVTMRQWHLVLYLLADALAVAMAAAYVAVPAVVAFGAALNSLLFATIALGLAMIAATLGRTADPGLRRALLVFLLLTIAFFPLMWADAARGWLPALALPEALDGVAFPLYFLALNSLSVGFGLRYLDRPAYAEGGRPTPFFLERFGISAREAEVIALLLEGATGKEIADRLYISAKTVENHVTNIYRKVGARNRVQLFRLIRANALEEPRG